MIIAVLFVLASCRSMNSTAEDSITTDPAKPPELWRSVLDLETAKTVKAVTWSEPLARFVAVGYAPGIGGIVMHSADGDVWSDASTSAPFPELSAVTWSQSLSRFVAVGDRAILHSADGDSWSDASLTSIAFHVDLYAVTWSQSLSRFVAVGHDWDSRSALIVHSADGHNWSEASASAAFDSLYDVIWSRSLSRCVAVGSGGLLHSDDGDRWSVSETTVGDIPSSDSRDVTWSSSLSLFVAVAGTNRTIVHSTDGECWSRATSVGYGSLLPSIGVTISGVAWSESFSRFVAVGNGFILHSDDGDTWELSSNGTWGLDAVAWSDSLARFFAVGYDPDEESAVIVHSDDGDSWTEAAHETPAGRGLQLQGVIANGSRIVAVGDSNTVVQAPTGMRGLSHH